MMRAVIAPPSTGHRATAMDVGSRCCTTAAMSANRMPASATPASVVATMNSGRLVVTLTPDVSTDLAVGGHESGVRHVLASLCVIGCDVSETPVTPLSRRPTSRRARGGGWVFACGLAAGDAVEERDDVARLRRVVRRVAVV